MRRSCNDDHQHDKAGSAESVSWDLALHNVHLNGEVGSEQSAKEGEQHCSERGQLHERRAPREAKHTESEGPRADLPSDEGDVGSFALIS
jgi:hypothetical protein